MLYFEAQKLTSQIGLNQLQMCELPNNTVNLKLITLGFW